MKRVLKVTEIVILTVISVTYLVLVGFCAVVGKDCLDRTVNS